MSDLIHSTSFRGGANLEPTGDRAPSSSANASTETQVSALQGARQSTQMPGANTAAVHDDKRASERLVSEAAPEQQQRLGLTRRLSEIIALAESLQTGQTPAADVPARLRQAVTDFIDVGGKSLEDEQGRTAMFQTLLGAFGKLKPLSAAGADGSQQPLFDLLVQTALQRLRPTEHADRLAAFLTHLTQAEAGCTPAVGAELTRQVLRLLTLEVVRSEHHEPSLELLFRHALQCAAAQRSPEWLAAVMGHVVHALDEQMTQRREWTLLPTAAVTLSKLLAEGETALPQVQATVSAVLGSVTEPYDADQLPELLVRLCYQLEPAQFAAVGRATAQWAKTHLPEDPTHVHCRRFRSCIKGFLHMGEHVKPSDITAFAYGMNQEWPDPEDQKRFAEGLRNAEVFTGFPAANGYLRLRSWDVDEEFGRGMNLVDAALERLDSKHQAENGMRLMKVAFAHGLATEQHLWAIDRAVRDGKLPPYLSVQDVLDLTGPELAPTVRRMRMTPEQLFAQAWTELAAGDADIESKSASRELDSSVAQRLLAATETIDHAVEAVVRNIGLAGIARQVEGGASAEALHKHEPQLRQHRAALRKHIEAVKVQVPEPQAASVSIERLARWRELCIAPLQAYVDMIDRIIGADLPETKSTSS